MTVVIYVVVTGIPAIQLILIHHRITSPIITKTKNKLWPISLLIQIKVFPPEPMSRCDLAAISRQG